MSLLLNELKYSFNTYCLFVQTINIHVFFYVYADKWKLQKIMTPFQALKTALINETNDMNEQKRNDRKKRSHVTYWQVHRVKQ